MRESFFSVVFPSFGCSSLSGCTKFSGFVLFFRSHICILDVSAIFAVPHQPRGFVVFLRFSSLSWLRKSVAIFGLHHLPCSFIFLFDLNRPPGFASRPSQFCTALRITVASINPPMSSIVVLSILHHLLCSIVIPFELSSASWLRQSGSIVALLGLHSLAAALLKPIYIVSALQIVFVFRRLSSTSLWRWAFCSVFLLRLSSASSICRRCRFSLASWLRQSSCSIALPYLLCRAVKKQQLSKAP